MAESGSTELISGLRRGEDWAAESVLRRFMPRLMALVSARFSRKLKRRLDPEDVVQSACRSFFIGIRNGRFSPERSRDLWLLLAGITLTKLYRHAEHHAAGKRALTKEQEHVPALELEAYPRMLARDPTPLEAAVLFDQVKMLFSRLAIDKRPVLELRLQGYKQKEIAQRLGFSERTVRRTLERIKRYLEDQMHD